MTERSSSRSGRRRLRYLIDENKEKTSPAKMAVVGSDVRSRCAAWRRRRAMLANAPPRLSANVHPVRDLAPAQSDARRHGARPHATAGSCFGGRLDWCRRLPSRCVSSLTATTARSSHLCPPRAGRVPRPDPSNNATLPSRRSRPLGRCGRRDDVHAALPRRSRSATPRFPPRGTLALSLSPSRALSRSAFGRETDRNLRVPVSTARLPLAARARQGELHPGGAPGGG